MNEQLREIDRVLKLVNREIWIVTAQHEGRSAGLTATWVTQASIDSESPMIVVGLAPNHATSQMVDVAGAFAVHLLAEEHASLAYRFAASSSRDTDKFAGLELVSGPCGSPILADSIAWLDCHVIARYNGGDRIYYWGRPRQGEVWRQAAPLCEQQFIAALSNEQLLELAMGREADIAVQRPLRRKWLGQ